MAASAREAEEDPSPPSSEPRRLIPGPWTHQETINLIEAYTEKWHSLNRGQLRTSHWDEITDEVRKRCGFSELSKTSVQCRHKMEKLRKRYRAEKQKGFSSWPLFRKMDFMANPSSSETHKEDSDTTENGGDADPQNLFLFMSNGKPRSPPTAADPGADPPRPFGSFSSSSAARFFGLRHGNSEISELAEAIRSLGDGFIKLERMKMELMREFERMRMEVEMQRTKMIIESQQQIAAVFAEALYARKKLKRMPSPES